MTASHSAKRNPIQEGSEVHRSHVLPSVHLRSSAPVHAWNRAQGWRWVMPWHGPACHCSSQSDSTQHNSLCSCSDHILSLDYYAAEDVSCKQGTKDSFHHIFGNGTACTFPSHQTLLVRLCHCHDGGGLKGLLPAWLHPSCYCVSQKAPCMWH